MSNKKAVQFAPLQTEKYNFRKLRQCRSCGSYTVLHHQPCAACGKRSWITMEAKALRLSKRAMRRDLLIALLLWAAALFFARNLQQIAICAAGGLTLCAGLVVLQRKVRRHAAQKAISALFLRDFVAIRGGLLQDYAAAVEDVKAHNEKGAYEKLREIGCVMNSQRLKTHKITLLGSFVLRRDMALEMDSLIFDEFDPDLIHYIGEICKIKRELIKQQTIDYVVRHEKQIQHMENGVVVLVGVVGAILRMRWYMEQYSNFILRYVRMLPRERFLRLCRLLRQQTFSTLPNGESLYEEAHAVYLERYAQDPEFQKLF